jgi:zinc protease
LRLVVIERHSLPLLTLRMVVRSGAEADPPELPGTAQLVAQLLNRGTAGRSAQEIAETIDRVGGSLDTGAEWDSSYVALTVLSDRTELAFDLLADMILRPAFRAAEIERRRKQTLSALQVLRDDPGFMADAALQILLLSGTPYGHPPDGTEESVQQIAERDLRIFHRQHYRPSNSILAAVGDISATQAWQLAQKYFGSWEMGGSPERFPANGRAASTVRRIVVIDKPDAVQTEIRVGNLAIPRDSPDYYALAIANQILGGPATNRLFKALRTQQGLTYGASSEVVCQRTVGSWTAKTFTRTRETARSLELVLEQLRRLRARAISRAELETAQGYLTGHLALAFETSPNIAAQVLELMVHDLPLDYWQQYPAKLRALGPGDVRGATERYLDPDRSVIVLVGDAQEFSRELRHFGGVEVIPLRELDLGSPTLRRAAPR